VALYEVWRVGVTSPLDGVGVQSRPQELFTQTLVGFCGSADFPVNSLIQEETDMKSLFKVAAIATMVSFGAVAIPLDASAATGTAYATKKAECKRKADGMHFGIHLIKRNRWIKDCIAGAH
jgi:hypothetical protein